ncbi:hypothetical protein [Mariniflexile soesokkakense]
MVNLSFYFSVFLAILLGSCESHSDYYFEESQSRVIDSLRHLGHYEYSSRLNDSLTIILKGSNNNLVSQTTYNTIESLTKKLTESKDYGCYVINWQTPETTQKYTDVILLERNPNTGIIIRMFTRNKYLIEKLPEHSY